MRCLVLHHCPKDVAAFARHFAFAACRTTHPGGWWDILIRWGNTDGPDADRTLNRAAAVNTAKNSDEVAQLLRANGLRFRSTDVEDDQTYRIHVVDLSVIAITRKGRDGRFRRVSDHEPAATAPAAVFESESRLYSRPALCRRRHSLRSEAKTCRHPHRSRSRA